VHFPSDVEAGRVLAGAVIDRLITVPEFRAALACAKAERRAALAGEKSEDQPACP
jgi:acid phosphatase (class A)